MVDIIRLHGDPHKQTQTLLPWYVNGTLDEGETATVEAHLAQCEECRAELESERALGREVASLPMDLDSNWAALQERAESGVRRKPQAVRPFLRRPVPIGWALAAQAASLALVVGLVWASTQQTHRLYHTLGSAPTAASGNVVVMFKPTTSEQELRGALVKSGARLVDGPTAGDAYVLHVEVDQRPSALASLRADAHVVLAEPIDGDLRP